MKQYRIGEVAKLVGISIDTLRYYEKLRLMPPVTRLGNGIRVYDDKDLSRLRFIRRAKTMKFTLEEIAALLELREGRQQARDGVRELTGRKLAEVEACIKELDALRRELRLLIDRCRETEQGCPIIERIDGSNQTD